MSFISAHNEIRTRLNTEWANATPIAFPNVSFNPPSPPSVWIRLTVNDGESQQIDIGSKPATIRYAGVIFVQIFTVSNKGDAEALTLADNVKTIFNNWNGVNVVCRAAKIINVGNDGQGWYQVNVAIPFIRDEQL